MKRENSQLKAWLGTGSINIFGLPFSGKDTHGHELARYFNAELIGGGDILRSDIGPKHIQRHIASGSLAPSDEYLAIVLPYFSQDKLENKPLVLSSVGRWDGEQISIMNACDSTGHPIKAVLYLKTEKKEVYRRWKLAERGRDDDAATEILEKRVNEFNEKTLPVLEFYRKKGLLIEVDAMPPKHEVTATIIKELNKLAARTYIKV